MHRISAFKYAIGAILLATGILCVQGVQAAEEFPMAPAVRNVEISGIKLGMRLMPVYEALKAQGYHVIEPNDAESEKYRLKRVTATTRTKYVEVVSQYYDRIVVSMAALSKDETYQIEVGFTQIGLTEAEAIATSIRFEQHLDKIPVDQNVATPSFIKTATEQVVARYGTPEKIETEAGSYCSSGLESQRVTYFRQYPYNEFIAYIGNMCKATVLLTLSSNQLMQAALDEYEKRKTEAEEQKQPQSFKPAF